MEYPVNIRVAENKLLCCMRVYCPYKCPKTVWYSSHGVCFALFWRVESPFLKIILIEGRLLEIASNVTAKATVSSPHFFVMVHSIHKLFHLARRDGENHFIISCRSSFEISRIGNGYFASAFHERRHDGVNTRPDRIQGWRYPPTVLLHIREQHMP